MDEGGEIDKARKGMQKKNALCCRIGESTPGCEADEHTVDDKKEEKRNRIHT